MSGGTGKDTIRNYGEEVLIKYKSGDGNDLITGFNETSTLQISGDSYNATTSGNDVIVTVGKGNITLQGAASLESVNIDGTKKPIILTLTNDDSAKITLAADVEIADATARTATIRLVGNALNNTILGGTKNDSLYGDDGADSLIGNAGNDKLYGQNGDDTLWGGAGNDTLKGGDGADIFIYSAGNDVIADYAVGDKISINAAISKTSIKGADATFTIGKDTLTVKDGKGKELVFIDANGTEQTIIGGAYLATDSSSANSTLAAWREVADASARTSAIKLTGNELSNTILGGSGKDSLYGADGDDYLVGNAGADKLYGQNGNDTLWGGIGNDSLKGGDGADVFIYNAGEGKDVITDFADDDLLQITGKFSASYDSSKKTIAFKVGSTASAITLKNFTATTFNVNGDAYKISGSKLVKR